MSPPANPNRNTYVSTYTHPHTQPYVKYIYIPNTINTTVTYIYLPNTINTTGEPLRVEVAPPLALQRRLLQPQDRQLRALERGR